MIHRVTSYCNKQRRFHGTSEFRCASIRVRKHLELEFKSVEKIWVQTSCKLKVVSSIEGQIAVLNCHIKVRFIRRDKGRQGLSPFAEEAILKLVIDTAFGNHLKWAEIYLHLGVALLHLISDYALSFSWNKLAKTRLVDMKLKEDN